VLNECYLNVFGKLGQLPGPSLHKNLYNEISQSPWTTYMSSAETHDEFIHHIAIKLSRALNIVNPNDLLAQRVTDIANTNTLPAFISGKNTPTSTPPPGFEIDFNLLLAANSFGKFQDSFLTDLHAEILSHAVVKAKQEAPQSIQGITVHDSTDVLVPEPARPGGLFQRTDSVCHKFLSMSTCNRSIVCISFQLHTFRKPARPLEPPTPRSSILGLDRLAKEKRAAAEADKSNADSSRKRIKLDGTEDPVFKGLYLINDELSFQLIHNQKFQTSPPQSRRICDKEARKLPRTQVDYLMSVVKGWKNTAKIVTDNAVSALSH